MSIANTSPKPMTAEIHGQLLSPSSSDGGVVEPTVAATAALVEVDTESVVGEVEASVAGATVNAN
ncbi:MAG: hypothetical protein QOJ08_564 [Ilumatobacteraceae bacterium]